MIKKIFLCFALCFCLTSLSTLESTSAVKEEKIGKFQLCATNGLLYILDTATGEVWKLDRSWGGYRWDPLPMPPPNGLETGFNSFECEILPINDQGFPLRELAQ